MGTEIIYAMHEGAEYDNDTKPTGKRVFHDTRMEVRSHEHQHCEIGLIFPTQDGDYGDPGIESEAVRVFGTFDRDGINRIIRSLRKARDRAYGKDE